MDGVTRGRLRIYLGAAPGVGKTYAALSETRRRAARGTDVVIGFVETHGRGRTAELTEGLEVLPRRRIAHRGTEFEEFDVDAALRRAPKVALVDELAHTNVPGSRNAKRWQDVEELLNAGVDVVSTVNIQHLESLNDVIKQITGTRQGETIPDEIVRRADQIELCDMSPFALRRRMSHGNIYPAEKVDAALSNYFREGNLTALRELALLWVADRVDEGLARYRGEHKIRHTWEARERIVVALTGGPEGETLIRRAARISARLRGGHPQPSHLMAVHVAAGDGLARVATESLVRQKRLLAELGGTYHQVIGDDVPTALLEFARGVNATQIVLGSSRRRSWQYVFGPGVGATVARESGDIDVHIVTHEEVGSGRGLPPPLRGAIGRARAAWGWAMAALLPPLLAGLLHLPPFNALGLTTDLLVFLTATVGVAMVGGLWPSIVSAVWGSVLLNLLFPPPLYRATITDADNTIALGVFVFVGVLVAFVVDLSKRHSLAAARARSEASTISLLAGSVLASENPLRALLIRIRETFTQRSVALLEQQDDGSWSLVESHGDAPCATPDEADALVSVSDSLALALRGRVLPASDRQILSAFASHIGIALERQRLARDAALARRQAAGNKIRTALLAAVSHDLRTPLTSIKASVSSLRSPEIHLDEADRGELLENIEESTDRLNGLVGNLLDMSRLQTESVTPKIREVGLEEVVPAALIGVPPAEVEVDVPDALPRVRVDAGLLERAVANVLQNAVRHSPAGGPPVRVAASAHEGAVELRIVDHGPGVDDEYKERIFEAFQRLGDAPRGTGIGLGLAVARGFAEAMDGGLAAEDTPGGGLTMVFTLRSAARPGAGPEPETEDA
ncbi:ATP-binding protein [Nocardiopsis baichengensis]|uniref:ATP-binding protein n=1 Tax=Nocardiopsis baichengensis TaxID=280240 RepID=UPI0012685534|nr:ATP-binding protein [Nocardiopsis baichengensis]